MISTIFKKVRNFPCRKQTLINSLRQKMTINVLASVNLNKKDFISPRTMISSGYDLLENRILPDVGLWTAD